MQKEDLMFFYYIRRPEEETLDDTRRRFFRELPEIDAVHAELHSQLKTMFLEFKRICDDNHINYFLMGGSYIGAVRANNFIPWDLDGDVGMLRSDYQKLKDAIKDSTFLELIEEEKTYKKLTTFDGREVSYILPRIRIKDGSSSIPIDIVLWDRVSIPEGMTIKEFWEKRREYREKYLSDEERNAFDCLKIASDEFLAEYGSDTGPYLCWAMENFVSMRAVIPERILPFDKVFPLDQISFCGEQFKIPGDGDYYIEGEWGDIWHIPVVNTLEGSKKRTIVNALAKNRRILEAL